MLVEDKNIRVSSKELKERIKQMKSIYINISIILNISLILIQNTINS
jgi:hypothetical protein